MRTTFLAFKEEIEQHYLHLSVSFRRLYNSLNTYLDLLYILLCELILIPLSKVPSLGQVLASLTTEKIAMYN